MTLFNRLLAVVLLIVFVAIGLVSATAPELAMKVARYWADLAPLTPQDRIYVAVGGVLLALAAAAVLYLEVRPARSKTVLVTRLSDGAAAIELQSVAQHVRQAVEALDGIAQASPQVAAKGRNVDILLTVIASHEVDVPEKASEIGAAVRDTVGKMGIGMGRQRIQLRYQSLPQKAS